MAGLITSNPSQLPRAARLVALESATKQLFPEKLNLMRPVLVQGLLNRVGRFGNRVGFVIHRVFYHLGWGIPI